MSTSGSATMCVSCRQAVHSRSMSRTICPCCGWDEKVGRRTCLKCEGPILLDYGAGFGTGSVVGIGLVGIPVFFMFGLLGLLTAWCALAAIGGLVSGLSSRYQCGMCQERADAQSLSSDERADINKKRTGFLLGAAGLGLATVFCAGLWLALWAAV